MGGAGEEAWLVRVLINICRDGWRKRAVRTRFDPVHAADSVVGPASNQETVLVAHTTVWRALCALAPRLADMKDFLPYKGYRLLDVQWILGSDRSATRLRGADEQEYQLSLRADALGGPQALRVAFHLQEPAAADTTINYTDDGQRRAQAAAIQDRIAQLEQEAAALRTRGAESERTLRMVLAQIAEAKRQLASAESAPTNVRGRSIIDTTFFMDVGETVVVGTSRIRGGDKALIALLTAVPKGGTAKPDD
jgi:hypothetical protein